MREALRPQLSNILPLLSLSIKLQDTVQVQTSVIPASYTEHYHLPAPSTMYDVVINPHLR